MTKTYEDELRIFEAREKLGLSKLKAKARETVGEVYKNKLDCFWVFFGLTFFKNYSVYACYPGCVDDAFK